MFYIVMRYYLFFLIVVVSILLGSQSLYAASPPSMSIYQLNSWALVDSWATRLNNGYYYWWLSNTSAYSEIYNCGRYLDWRITLSDVEKLNKLIQSNELISKCSLEYYSKSLQYKQSNILTSYESKVRNMSLIIQEVSAKTKLQSKMPNNYQIYGTDIVSYNSWNYYGSFVVITPKNQSIKISNKFSSDWYATMVTPIWKSYGKNYLDKKNLVLKISNQSQSWYISLNTETNKYRVVPMGEFKNDTLVGDIISFGKCDNITLYNFETEKIQKIKLSNNKKLKCSQWLIMNWKIWYVASEENIIYSMKEFGELVWNSSSTGNKYLYVVDLNTGIFKLKQTFNYSLFTVLRFSIDWEEWHIAYEWEIIAE